jgi:hypothetical protein
MDLPNFSLKQIRAVLVKCSARLADIVSRSTSADPGALTISPAHHGELHDVIVHAVVTLRSTVPHAARYRTMITQAYASGVDRSTRLPTIESVQCIGAVLDTVVVTLGTDD